MDARDDAICVSASINNTSQKVAAAHRVGAYAKHLDVPCNSWAHGPVERLYFAGFTAGCVTNPLMYCPDNGGTRAEMRVLLERGRNGSSYVPLDHRT